MPATATPRHSRQPPAPDRRARLSAVARFTLLEAWRSRLPWLLVAALACALAIAVLAAALAITESGRFRAALFAGGLRFSWVFILAVYVIGSLTRELNERGFETALSLEITRTTWILGKLAGFVALAALAAAVALPVLLAFATPAAALAWSVSLLFELAIVVAAATFFTLSLASLPAAAALTAGFYLLARSIDALVLIAGGSPLLAPGGWRDLARAAIEAAGWLLPSLGRYAPASWLVDALPAASLLALQFGQAAAYVGLLAAAALVDFHRRDL